MSNHDVSYQSQAAAVLMLLRAEVLEAARRAKAVKLRPLALVDVSRPGRPIRYDMTARILPRRSAEAASTYVVATRERRIAMVEELSAELWALAKLPLPSYSRAEMPVHIMPRARRSPSP